MKFIIAQATVRAGNEQCVQFNAAIHSALGVDAPDTQYDDVVLTSEFENFSVTKDMENNYVVEMNDECVLKFMRLYVKAARVIAPFVKPILGLIEMLKTDMNEIEEFIGKRK